MSKNFKKKGISGRPSREIIEQRILLCRELYQENPYLTAKDFENKFKEKLQRYDIDIPSSAKTFKKIYEAAHISLYKGEVELDEDILLSNLRDVIEEHINQIRVQCKSAETILYNLCDIDNDELNRNSCIGKSSFLSRLDIINTYIADNNINTDSLTTIYILLDTVGFEKYIEDILEKELVSANECLYIETHRRCVKLILEYKDLLIVSEKLYKLIRNNFFRETNINLY